MGKMFARIDTVFLHVKDFQNAIQWYESVLDFEVRWKNEEGGYCALNIGETPLTLVRSKEVVNPSDNCLFNFYTADIEKAYEHLQSRGVEVFPIEDFGGVQSFEFLDLEGNKLGVCWFQE